MHIGVKKKQEALCVEILTVGILSSFKADFLLLNYSLGIFIV